MTTLSQINLQDAVQARAVILADTASLAADLKESAAMLKALASETKDERGTKQSVSAMLATTALRAVLAGCEDAVKEAYDGSEDWKRIKGTWSAGSKFARELLAGNTFKVPVSDNRDKPTIFTIGDKAYVEGERIGKDVLSALANPQDGDTTIMVLAKARSAYAKQQRTQAAEREQADKEVWGAFLHSPEGKRFLDAGEDAETVALAIRNEAKNNVEATNAIADAMRIGAAHVNAMKAKIDAENAENQRKADVINALGVISRSMNDETVSALEAMIAEYRTRDIPAQNAQVAGTVAQAA